MRGYLQKCRGRAFWAMEAVCEGTGTICPIESEQVAFDGRRQYALCSAKREGTALTRKNLAESVFAFAMAELPHLPWLSVVELVRFMLVCDTAARHCPGSEFALNGQYSASPHALQLIHQWAIAPDDELAQPAGDCRLCGICILLALLRPCQLHTRTEAAEDAC